MNRVDSLQRPERARLYWARAVFEWAAIHGTNEQFRQALAKLLHAQREVT